MEVIIIGANRAEICTVKLKDLDKHYFMTRKQLYKVYPSGLTRMDCIDLTGPEPRTTTEEVIVYSENSSIPYHPRKESYETDALLWQIDQHKEMNSGLLSRGQLFFKQAASAWKSIAPVLPLLIVGVILLWAFI